MSEEPTYVELVALVGMQQQVIVDLEARLGSSSRNSSKPPSSDGLGKPAPKSLRGKSARRPGGQDGHRGRTLRQVLSPDEVIRHEPVVCAGCGIQAIRGAQVGTERRQVFDLPPVAIRVTEHQLITRQCACGVRTTGCAPDRVNAPVQYGPRVLAAITYSCVGQFLSKKRTAQAMSDLLGVPVSEGTVGSATERAAADLTVPGGFTDLVRAALRGSPLVHFDETGLRVQGRLHWLHSAGTSLLTLLHMHRRRGCEAIDDAGVLPGFTGVAVHDAWAPYDTYTDASHVLCGAHVLRELQAVIDAHQAGFVATVIDRWSWAAQVTDNLLALKAHVEQAWAGSGLPDPDIIARHTRLILDAARIAADDQTSPGRLGKSIGRWPDGSATGIPTTWRSPPAATYHSTTTPRRETSAWSRSGRKYPAAYAPSPAPNTSPRSAPTPAPPVSRTSTFTRRSPSSPLGIHGYQAHKPPD